MDDVFRHYDVTGKNCPKYYVENPDAWIQMKSDIAAQIDVDYGLQDVQKNENSAQYKKICHEIHKEIL